MAEPPIRTITLIRAPDDRGVFVFRIVAERRTAFYVGREIPCQIGGRGFAVHKLGIGDLMHVRVGRPDWGWGHAPEAAYRCSAAL